LSAIPAETGRHEAVRLDGDRAARPQAGLSRPAWLCFWLILAAATAATLPFLARLEPDTRGWATFAVLATGAAVAQLFLVVTPGNQSYHVTGVFLIAAALLLPPELVALIAFVQHVPDWLKRRMPFHIQAFNIANYTLATMAAWAVVHEILALGFLDSRGAGALVAGVAACVVFVGLNHVLLAPMLRLARSLSFRESGLFSYSNLSTDLVLAGIGIALATLWAHNTWLVPFALVTLVLVHRSLSVPALQAEARIDSKTGLFNARHFATTLREEVNRAVRFGRPMSVIMADLDLLRDINNTYGHLAGDAVLTGVGKIFREELREYDVPSRFGGEEFAILLPETTPEEAFEIALRIRRAVAASEFTLETSGEPIRATISLGVASYPRDGDDANELIHQADVAVYRAKLQGRNRVLDASNEPLLAARPAPQAPRLAVLAEENVSLEQANRQLRERSTAAMESVSARVDAREKYTAGHSRRVQQIALAIGRELGLSEDELEVLGYAALFHDIGKLAVPDSILLKPTSLTADEWALMKQHAGEGASIIDRLGFLNDAVPAIWHHHERFDGRGYPDGLAGEEIPLGARIIHVADAYDSMLSTRVYRPARLRDAALAELRAGAGAQFCPRCVGAMEALMTRDGTLPPPEPQLTAVAS
jgi:diguanylate cyclase (GGDEF)-like protein/putative nucleotidyltransferase with HDIG domain